MSVKIKGRVSAWGNSIAFRVPKLAVELLDLQKGEDIEFLVDPEKGTLSVLKERRKEKLNLKELVAQYKPEQDHPLYEIGEGPKGKEVW